MNLKPLLVVSNRLPFVIKNDNNGNPVRCNSAGGLVTALTPLVVKSNGYWIGWAGNDLIDGTELPESNDPNSISHELKSSQVVPVYYNEKTFKLFYNGMCNECLWPLMHSLTSNLAFKYDYWSSYVEVNNKFSFAALGTLKKMVKENKNNTLS